MLGSPNVCAEFSHCVGCPGGQPYHRHALVIKMKSRGLWPSSQNHGGGNETALQSGRGAGGIWREDLQRGVQLFADDGGRLHTPLAVLVALQNVSLCTLGVQVLGAWTLPHYFKDEITDWREGENLFFHPEVPRSFWPEYLKQF